MNTITTVAGDTFESISRRAYGTHTGADQIRRSNPGVLVPIQQGTVVSIPPRTDAVRDRVAPVLGASPEEVTVLISGERFRLWTDVALSEAIDKPNEVRVASVWEPDSGTLRQVFRPFSFQDCEVFIGDERLFRGTMLSPESEDTPSASTISANGYGPTGTLSDCTMPASAYPLEFENQAVDVIARALLQPFGYNVRFEAEAGAPFELVSLEPGEKVIGFLAKLAQQRNLVIGENPAGEAVFRRSNAGGSPVAIFEDGDPALSGMRANFKPQEYFSHITAIAPVIISGLGGDQFTAANPHLRAPIRPMTFGADDSEDGQIEEAANAKIGRMFANMVSWSLTLPTWRDSRGNLWRSNTTIMVTRRKAFIYRPTELLIRSLTRSVTPGSRTVTLELVLPGAFAGLVPEVLPWDE